MISYGHSTHTMFYHKSFWGTTNPREPHQFHVMPFHFGGNEPRVHPRLLVKFRDLSKHWFLVDVSSMIQLAQKKIEQKVVPKPTSDEMTRCEIKPFVLTN